MKPSTAVGVKHRIRLRMDNPAIFPDVSEEHAAALGYVVIRWSAVEAAVAHMIYNLLTLHSPVGVAVTANMSAQAKIDLATTLIQLTGNET